MPPPREMGRGAWWTAFIAIAIVTVLPLLVVDMPPLEDYPGHLARMYVYAFGSGDPFLSHMYVPSWHIIPNLATDLITPPLLRIMPLHVAGRVVLGLMLLLPFGGIVALHHAIFRRRSWWPLAGALIACNGLFLMGFMNFIVGIGVSLFVFELWTVHRERHPVLATIGLALGAVAAFFSHILAVGLLTPIVACTMAEDLWHVHRRGEPVARMAGRNAVVLAVAFAAPVALYLASALAEAPGPVAYTSLRGKIAHIFVAFFNYDFMIDAVTVLIVLGVPTSCLLLRNRTGRRTAELPMRTGLCIAALLLLYAVAPWRASGGACLDLRFSLMATFMLFAGFDPHLPRRLTAMFVLCLAALFLLRTSIVASVWNEHNAELRDIRQVIQAVPPGSRVLVVQVSPETNPAWWSSLPHSHRVDILGSTDDFSSALLVPERKVFWPLMFAYPSQQPLKILPPYRDLLETCDPPDYRELADSKPDLSAFPFLRDWQRRYDYVYLINPAGSPDASHFMPATLSVVTTTPSALVWRINNRPAGNNRG